MILIFRLWKKCRKKYKTIQDQEILMNFENVIGELEYLELCVCARNLVFGEDRNRNFTYSKLLVRTWYVTTVTFCRYRFYWKFSVEEKSTQSVIQISDKRWKLMYKTRTQKESLTLNFQSRLQNKNTSFFKFLNTQTKTSDQRPWIKRTTELDKAKKSIVYSHKKFLFLKD